MSDPAAAAQLTCACGNPATRRNLKGQPECATCFAATAENESYGDD